MLLELSTEVEFEAVVLDEILDKVVKELWDDVLM